MTITKLNISLSIFIILILIGMVVNVAAQKTLSHAVTNKLVSFYALNDSAHNQIEFVKGPFN